MLKAAIIGCGFIHGTHRNAYAQLEKEGLAKLVAICDIRKEKLTELPYDGLNLYTDVDDLLEKEELDMVSICLPTYLHKDMAIKFMKAGINVVCEKPMSLQYEDCMEMLRASEETGKYLMIAHSARFGRDLRIIKDFLDSGKGGGLVSAFFQSADGTPYWSFEDWYKDGTRSGGCMLDLQAHNLDLINWFFGLPKYTSTTAKQCAPDFTGFGSISANMVYENGVFVHSWCDWGIPNNKHLKRYTRINLEKGYIYSDRMNTKELVWVDGETGEITDLSNLRPELQGLSTQYCEIKHFIECMEKNVPIEMGNPIESAKVIKIMRAQESSAKNNGAPVEIV